MKQVNKRHTDEFKLNVLSELHNGADFDLVCDKHNIKFATLQNWVKYFDKKEKVYVAKSTIRQFKKMKDNQVIQHEKLVKEFIAHEKIVRREFSNKMRAILKEQTKLKNDLMRSYNAEMKKIYTKLKRLQLNNARINRFYLDKITK